MKLKFTSLLMFSLTLLTACTSTPISTQKASTEFKKGRLPTSFSEHSFTCIDDAAAGLKVEFDYKDDGLSSINIKNIRAANTDTNLIDQKYNVVFDSQTSESGLSTLMIATYHPPQGRTIDRFSFQVATEIGTPAQKAKPARFSILNLMGQVRNTNLVCCNEALKPIKNEGAWHCN